MNDLTHSAFANGSPATMGSREIAELCEKEHKHVLRDIRVMIDALGDGPDLGYVEEAKDSRGYTLEFRLPKDLTMTLVSGYNVHLRHRIVRRLAELEGGGHNVFAIPTSYAEALRLAADNADRAEKAEARIAEDAPKVAFAEQVEAAPDAITLGQAAKIFSTGRNRFCQWLREIGWLTRTNEPYQDKITSGYLDVKLGSWDHPEKGLQRSVTALVTGKGMAKLHRLREASALPKAA